MHVYYFLSALCFRYIFVEFTTFALFSFPVALPYCYTKTSLRFFSTQTEDIANKSQSTEICWKLCKASS